MTEPTQAVDIPMLTVDDQNHVIAELPKDIQELISYYQSWDQALKTQRIEAYKTEAAMRHLSGEITTRVKLMVADRAGKEAADAAEGEKLKAAATEALTESIAANDASQVNQ
jgi:hypothetical protein